MPNLPFAKKWRFVDFLLGKKFLAVSVMIHASLAGIFFLGSNIELGKNAETMSCSLMESASVRSLKPKSTPSPLEGGDHPSHEQLSPRNPLEKRESSSRKSSLKAGPPLSSFKGGRVVANHMRPPVLLSKEMPRIPYPAEAKHLRVEGVVKLELTIDEEGQVRDAKVIEDPGFGLTAQALKLVKMLRFLPALNPRGEREMASIMHEVVFRLNRRDG